MTRVRELIAVVARKYPKDPFFEDFAESCRLNADKKRAYRTYDDALRLLDSESWDILKNKAVQHFRDHRKGQTKQGFSNQLNEAFAYRYLVRRGYNDIRLIGEETTPTPDIRYLQDGQPKHCEVKTLGVSDAEIQRRHTRGAFDGRCYHGLGEGFLNKFSTAIATAKRQIRAQGTDGLVYLVVLWDDMALDWYQEYRRQIISYCRKRTIRDVYIKVGLRWSRRIRIIGR